MEVTFNILADDTLAYIIANVAVATYDDADGTERTWGASNVAKETSSDDDDVEAFPDQYVGADFAGGEDPEDIAITLDEDDQEVTVRYAPVEDTLGEIFDAIDAAGYAATLIYGTSADGTPEDPPFARPFRSGIVVEREDDDDGDVTPGGGLAAADVKGLYPVSWAEAATPGAENVGLVQNIEGALFDHDVRHHDGHGKVVSYTDLTHADFRGWYHRAPDNLTSGQFFYVTAYNAFEIRRVHGEDGWTGVTGVFTYDPFATGEPWATAMIGGAATALVYQRQVSNEDLADDRATALAQVFAIADGSRIAYVSAFTARQDGYDEFFRHLYVARPRQIAEFWGFGQTESFADLPVDHVATAGAFFRYRFSQEKPNFSIGPDFGARAVDASDVLFIDLITGETALLDQHVVKLPAGIYDFNMAAAHRQTGDTSLGFWIYRVVSGADDIALFVGVAYSTIQQGPFAIVEAERYAQNIQVHRIFNFSETSYLTMLSGTFNHPTTGPDGSYALTVEKLG